MKLTKDEICSICRRPRPAHHTNGQCPPQSWALGATWLETTFTAENDTPLQANIEGEQLVIRIGIDRLTFCSRKENGGPLKLQRVIPGRERQFAEEVAKMMMSIGHIGETELADFLNDQIIYVSQNGCAELEKE